MKQTPCPKSGVKIHESRQGAQQQHQPPRIVGTNKMQQQMDYHQTRLKHHEEQLQALQQRQPQRQQYQQQQQTSSALVPMYPQQQQQMTLYGNQVEQQPSPYDGLDLDLSHYNFEEIMKLFDITDVVLTDETMKMVKRKVLKLHPDKCKLDPKFYEFFQKAYKHLESVYQFQNANVNRKARGTDYSTNDVFEEDNSELLKTYFQKQGGFNNKQFNEQFEKFRIPEENDRGYDDWFKSEEGLMGNPEGKMSKEAMHNHIEQKKRELCSVVEYKGVSDKIYSGSTAGGILLDTSKIQNYSGSTSGDIFSNGGMVFTDLKQAYTETLIPVTEDDYHKRPQYRNVNDYNAMRSREATNYKVMSDAESQAYIREQERMHGMEAANSAMRLSRRTERQKEQTASYWSTIKQLTFGEDSSVVNGRNLLR